MSCAVGMLLRLVRSIRSANECPEGGHGVRLRVLIQKAATNEQRCMVLALASSKLT